MEIYILVGIEFDGFDPSSISQFGIGAYLTQAEAESALKEFERKTGRFDSYRIARRVIGAAAECEY